MKMTINKDFTSIAQVAKVKEDMREFKSRYNDNDLLQTFQDSTGLCGTCSYEVLKATVEAFPKGMLYGDDTTFCVELFLYGCNEFAKVRFYCGLNLEVDTSDLMWFGNPADNPHKKLYQMTRYTEDY